jgi:hypothetical protein
MATRFTYQVAAAALGIGLSLLLGRTAIAALSNTAAEIQLDPPAAPSDCRSRLYRGDPLKGGDLTIVSWRDNSTNEDGFILETWRKQSGTWVLVGSFSTTVTSAGVWPGRVPTNYKFRVKAFSAAGDSAWSNWAH